MEFVSKYVSRQADADGNVHYSSEEHEVWARLYQRQMQLLPNRACDAFMEGLSCLNLSPTEIPQLNVVSATLKRYTGWQVAPVRALISAREFFQLLANRYFPAATFIRTLEELDYVQEPDVFHELFGHCPLLTHQTYADFIWKYANKVLEFPEKDWPLLQRLFWFTVEFGLIHTPAGIRAYGGGILSSISETAYSVESDIPVRAYFNPVTAFRTPYRIDMLQRVYFVIDNFEMLYQCVEDNLLEFIEKARELGEFPPFFPVDENNPSIHILAC